MDTLTNIGTAYDTTAASKGLGFTDYDLTGVTSLVFTVRQSRVGSGTVSWQLWNETDSSQVAVVSTAVSGDSYLTTTVALALTGIKRLRVRAKSTVSTDDPLYYGCAIRLIRG